jgi:putative membrane protein
MKSLTNYPPSILSLLPRPRRSANLLEVINEAPAPTGPLFSPRQPRSPRFPRSRSYRRRPVAKLDDPTIIAIFDAANTWDMETGALAARKGTTKDIREFGAMLERDHRVVRQQGTRPREEARRAADAAKGTSPWRKDHAAALNTLNSLSGKAFDRAFLAHEVAFHKAVIDAVTTTLLPALKNEEARGARDQGRTRLPGSHGGSAKPSRQAAEVATPRSRAA